MKSFGRIAIAAMLAIVPMVAAGTVWANTELVPGARLVAPYWDISGTRSTLVLLTNVSKAANLQTGATPALLNGVCNLGGAGGVGPATACGVHLEFYDKTCQNFNTPIDLSKRDLDQLDLLADAELGGVRGLPSGFGWLDVDVRTSPADHGATGVQANVLVGTVIVTDGGSDFVVAYPMAASIGSAGAGIGGNIVTRTPGGNAVAWTGSYETFPARVFVPMFFAEGSNHGLTFTSTLAIAGPAQALSGGEAPGQDLSGDLIDAAVQVVDACENEQSDAIAGHYIKGTLDALLAAQVTAPYKTTCAYPAADVDNTGTTTANAFQGGWIDIRNDNAFGCLTTGGVVTCLNNTVSPPIPFGIPRGMVGVLVQNTPSKGDVTRLWGDCAYGIDFQGNSASSGCRADYSLVNSVSHADIKP